MAESPKHVGRPELEAQLSDWGIEFETVEHPEVFTVEQALPHVSHLEGTFAKNLFLRDKKKRLFLFCAPHDTDVKLNDLAKLIGAASGGLRFADESVLQEKLGLTQGAVTLFGIINDKNKDVQLVLDKRFTDGSCPKIHFHPMVNSASTAITPEGLKTFVDKCGHKPKVIELSEPPC